MSKILNWSQFNVSETEITGANVGKVLIGKILASRGVAYNKIYSVNLDPKDMDFVKDQLSNDENSSDEEMADFFKKELKISDKDAKTLVSARGYFRGLDDIQVIKLLATIADSGVLQEKIAKRFSELLAEEIGPEELAEVVALNKKEKDKSICHSHDFTDSNVLMSKAFDAVNINLERDFPDAIQNEFITETWNKAWDLAKKNNFYIK